MRVFAILFLCAVPATACSSEASVRAGASLEAEALVRLEPSSRQSPPAAPLTAGPVAAPPPTAAAQCNENYDPCVPVSSDVDCPGGQGNGPAYARGPVQVIGRDVYGLDRDNDGTGCE